jgi:tetratricopeptide (TPR) repeat protein
VLEQVVDIDTDRLVDLCDAAVAAGILGEGQRGGYTFAHALIERALYDGLSGNRRALAHRAVAEALEHLHGEHPDAYAGQLAHHWANVVRPSDAGKAVGYALLAGDRAMATLAPEEALRWYAQAVELLDTDPAPEPGVRARLLVGLGDAQRLCGVPEYRDTLLHAARLADRIDDVELLVCAVLANHRGFQSSLGTVDSERVEVIDRALERLGDDNLADRARLLALSCMERTYDATLEERIDLADDAIATARRSGDREALAETLTRVCRATVVPWTLGRRIAWSDEACQIAETLRDPSVRFYAHLERYLCALESGRLAELRTLHEVVNEISDRVPHAGLRWITAFMRVVPAVLVGDLDDAEQLAGEAFALGLDTSQPDTLTIYGGHLIDIRSRQGRLGELLPLIEEVAANTPDLPLFRAILASCCVETGDNERARQLFEESRDLGFPADEDLFWSTLHVYWSELAVVFGDHRAAATLQSRLAPFADQIVTTGPTVSPAIGHYVAKLGHLLGRHEDADASFRRALAIHQQLEAPAFIAMTQVAWAAMLTDCGRLTDLDHARTLAADALHAAEQHGYGATERDARAVLRALDSHPTH